jgi:hypothetical protein
MALSHALVFVRALVKRWRGSCGLGYGAAKGMWLGVPTLSQRAEGHVCGGVYRESSWDPARSESLGTYGGLHAREPGGPVVACELLLMPRPGWFAGWRAAAWRAVRGTLWR